MNSFLREACASCGHSVVCSIRTMLVKSPELDAAMGGCRHYEAAMGFSTDNEFRAVTVGETAEKTHRNVLEDVQEVSTKIKAITKKTIEEPEIVKAAPDKTCVSCGATDVDMIACSNCGGLVCGDCMTETTKGKVLCEACYDKEEPLVL